jgi:TfoX/Sxy family transcriptional regulator of competence genes
VPVALDVDLADRIRELLGGEVGVSEQRMFGGLAFLVGGHMAIAVSGQGGVLVRVAPTDADRLVRTTHAEVARMGSRVMRGWVRVGPEYLRTTRQLGPWVRRGVESVRELPPKGSGRRAQSPPPGAPSIPSHDQRGTSRPPGTSARSG